MPIRLYPVLLHPVRQSLIAAQPDELGRFRLVAVRSFDRPSQVVARHRSDYRLNINYLGRWADREWTRQRPLLKEPAAMLP